MRYGTNGTQRHRNGTRCRAKRTAPGTRPYGAVPFALAPCDWLRSRYDTRGVVQRKAEVCAAVARLESRGLVSRQKQHPYEVTPLGREPFPVGTMGTIRERFSGAN